MVVVVVVVPPWVVGGVVVVTYVVVTGSSVVVAGGGTRCRPLRCRDGDGFGRRGGRRRFGARSASPNRRCWAVRSWHSYCCCSRSSHAIATPPTAINATAAASPNTNCGSRCHLRGSSIGPVSRARTARVDASRWLRGARHTGSRRCTGRARSRCRRPATRPARCTVSVPAPVERNRRHRRQTGLGIGRRRHAGLGVGRGRHTGLGFRSRSVCREERSPHRCVEGGLRCRHDGCARVLRKALCDQWDARTATHSDNRADVRPANPVALQDVIQGSKDADQRSGDQRLQLRSRQPDSRPVAGQVGDDLGPRCRRTGVPWRGRHSSLSRRSDPTAAVPAGSIPPVAAMPSTM